VEGQITLNKAESVNVDGDGPNMFGIQLNAVVTEVTLFGNATDQFWMQNFVSYTPASGELVFGDNVWNFSNFDAYISPNVFYATGPNGTLYAPVFYYAVGPTFTIHYPFTINFYENSTVLFDRPAVYFNYTVSNSTMRKSGSYDYVVFNSTAGTPTSAFPAGVFQINGNQVDPVGLPNDLELDVVGNDDGDTTTFYQMDATLSISVLGTGRTGYAPVPSAVDAGSETGETSDGVSVSYAGSAPIARMTLGPSFLYGLWNESSSSGARKVVQSLHPANTMILVNPGSARDESRAQWVPGSPSGVTTFYVPNSGPYWIEYLLSDRNPGSHLLNSAANATTMLAFSGVLNLARGVYTPLIAFGNGELAGISSGGTGSMANPYTIYNNQYGPIDQEFAAWNDFQFPVFPGLLLIGTTDYVTVTAPSFHFNYPSWMIGQINGYGLPSSNELQLQFWETSHVRVLGGTISGWLSAFLEGFPEGSVMFWNSSYNLVAGSTFLDQGDAIVLYGGTGNTIWGNWFFATVVGASQPGDVLDYGAYTQAVNESESGDLIYNNYLDVPFPAITPTFDPLSCQILCEPANYIDRWNVSLQPATDVRMVDGVALAGNILGMSREGGNYWVNYGSLTDPYGILPYTNGGAITSGGDYHPLLPFTLQQIRFREVGLAPATAWSVTLNGYTQSSTGRTITFWEPSGVYAFTIGAAGGHMAHPATGWASATGHWVFDWVHFT
jgi:thermopsin